MNLAHLHLLMNHLPILGTLFGILILLYGYFRKNDEITKLALYIFIFAAIMVIPVYLTGDPSEDAIKNMPGVSEQLIEDHENPALFAFILVDILGAASVFALYIEKKNLKLFKKIILYSFIYSFIVLGFMTWVGTTGGNIRHTEIRSGYVPELKKANPVEKNND